MKNSIIKVLQVNSTDSGGGAAIAAKRLQDGLRINNVDSSMVVMHKTISDDPYVLGRSGNIGRITAFFNANVDAIPLIKYKSKLSSFFSTGYFPARKLSTIGIDEYDIINMHWICGGFIGVKDLKKIKKPIVWTLHDMWPFTGGCHYSDNCSRYENSCGMCPQIESAKERDITRTIFEMKQDYWKDLDITVVTPSKWLGDCAEKSSLFKNRKVHVIPNGIDTDFFKAIDKKAVREKLGLPINRKIILFGAVNATTDRRKGYDLLEDIFKHYRTNFDTKETVLAVFGSERKMKSEEFGIEAYHLGKINGDESLREVYSSADLFIQTSRQDNLPNTNVEAMSCGLPSVAFNVGGLRDLVENDVNGYLIKSFDSLDFAKHIQKILGDDAIQVKLSSGARNKALRDYNLNVIAKKYSDLYAQIISRGDN